MKRLMGWMTLGFAGMSLGFLALAFLLPTATAALCAAAICWAAGFAWFVKFGRRARGRMRRVFAAAFLALCAVPVGCAVWCVLVFLKI